MASVRDKVDNGKYKLIYKKSSIPKDKDMKIRESNDYAEFLKNFERKCCSYGFLDSSFYIKKFGNSSEIEEKPSLIKPKSSPSPRNTPRLIDVSKNISNNEQEFHKTFKAIEDGMWRAKQQERELKRYEGDILKNQQETSRSLREYEKEIMKKRYEEDLKMADSVAYFEELRQEYLQNKHQYHKEKSTGVLSDFRQNRDHGRKAQVNMLSLTHRYKAKVDELNLKNVQKQQLAKEFETKLRLKEDEEIRLKKELAEISTEMQMESLKNKRIEVETEKKKKMKSVDHIKKEQEIDKEFEDKITANKENLTDAEEAKKKYEADLEARREIMNQKMREDRRALVTTRRKLNQVAEKQRQLNQTAKSAKLELKQNELRHRQEMAENRRLEHQSSIQQARMDSVAEIEKMYQERALRRQAEVRRREHEDSLKHFNRTVSYSQQMEHSLFTGMKSAELTRQQEEQKVKRLEEELNEARKRNVNKFREDLSQGQLEEKLLEQQLVRAKAELSKALNMRETLYNRLVSHRSRLANDKEVMEYHSKDHERLQRIAEKTDSMQPSEIYA